MTDIRYKRRSGLPGSWLALVALSGVLVAGACKSESSGSDDSGEAGAGTGAQGEGGASTGGLGQLAHAGTGADQAQAGEGSGEGGGAGSHCGESRIEATKRPVNLLLLIDRSKSMDSPPRDAGANGTAGASGDAGGAQGQASVGGAAGSASGDIAAQGGAGGVASAAGASGASPASEATKWDLLKDQLVDALGRAEEDLSYGMLLFPDSDDVELTDLMCEMPAGSTINVPVAQGPDARADIETVLDDTAPAGSTPTAAALGRALEYFTNGEGRDLEGDNYVLLATDGGPNCNSEASCGPDRCIPNIAGICPESVDNCCESVPESCVDDQATTDALDALRKAHVKTFIVGIPGSELFSGFLDDFAEAGDMARTPTSDAPYRYYKVEAAGNMQGLSDVLIEITGSLITRCDLQLEEEPPDLAKLNVYVDGIVVPQEGDDGWSVEGSTDPPTIHIKGETCRRIETEGAESVSVQYGCPTVKLL
jgi:hypothetical protein